MTFDQEQTWRNGGPSRLRLSVTLVLSLLVLLVSCRKLDGTFMYINTIPPSSINAYLDELQSLQMTTIITSSFRHKDACSVSAPWQWYPSNTSGLPSYGPTYLHALLQGAAARNMKVYIGLPVADGTCIYDYDPTIVQQVYAEHPPFVQFIEANYSQYASFAGWHIIYEPEIAKFWNDADPQTLYATINANVKANSTKPVLVSPILNDFDDGLVAPQEIGRRAKLFWQKTGIDIQVWQLTLGAIAIWNRPGRHLLAEYTEQISTQLGKARFWGNYESFNLWPNYDSNRPRGGDGKPSAVSNLFGAIAGTSDHVSKSVTWIQQREFGIVDQFAEIGSLRMRETYKAAFEIQGAIRVAGGGYTYHVGTPDPLYQDSGNELFNSKTGDPLTQYFNVGDWVGIHGDVAVDIVLHQDGLPKHVDWVAVHVWNISAYGIRFPTAISLRCAATVGGAFNSMGSWNNPLPLQPSNYYEDSIYVIGNTTALNADCAKVRVRLENSGYFTFLSEIEIASSEP